MARKISIAIDGPAGSGKSTTARLLARELGYIYIDTGAMYRAVTYAVLQNKIDVNNEKQVSGLAGNLNIKLKMDSSGQRTMLNDKDVSDLIRTPAINEVISIISTYSGVRRGLVLQQQKMARNGGVVMDGRDIGTVVLPNAELKVFLIASVEERAKRRLKELENNGIKVRLDDVKKEITNRDQIDSSRKEAPLKKAEDARELDTSELSIEDQVRIIKHWAEELIVLQ
jgi:cytidylate kinase